MLYLIFLAISLVLNANGYNIGCDFESPCSPIKYDTYWNLALAEIPFATGAPDIDHTYENSSGHYIYFDINAGSKYKQAIVSFDKMFNFTNDDEQKCLKFFYVFNSDGMVNLTVRFSMGDQFEVQSTWLTINSLINQTSNWSLAELNLPSDAYSIQIVLDLPNSNFTSVILTLDDIFVTNECTGKITQTTKILYLCDFERDNCDFENTMKLEWNRVQPNQSDDTFPKRDHTLNSTTGYYLRTSKNNDGNLGHLERIVSSAITIPDDGTPYCASFYYYSNTRSPFRF